jgi:hypothetical protein
MNKCSLASGNQIVLVFYTAAGACQYIIKFHSKQKFSPHHLSPWRHRVDEVVAHI